MSFDVRQLRYAIAAADHGSFYRAARALDIEQSTLSRSILKLEHAVGTLIFLRSRAGVSLTPAGKEFILGARPLVADLEKLATMMRSVGQGHAGGLRLGHYHSISAGNLRATLTNWRDAHPDVRVEYVEANRSKLLADLNTGDIDVAVMMGARGHPGFRCKQFWSERMFVALTDSHPLSARDVVLWSDLASERFLLPAADPGPEIRDLLLRRLSTFGIQPDIGVAQSSRETILCTLSGSSSVSIVCEGATGARYPEVVYRPMHGEQGPALTSYSGYWRSDNQNPALRRFLEFISQRYALTSETIADLLE